MLLILLAVIKVFSLFNSGFKKDYFKMLPYVASFNKTKTTNLHQAAVNKLTNCIKIFLK